MASPSGGPANKNGNRYEAYYVVAAALEVIEGDAQSLQLEGVGNAFEGIEFRQQMNDGTVRAVQCKSARDRHWTIAALADEGILSSIKVQLTSLGADHFQLVVAGRAPQLLDLSERARAASDPPAFAQCLTREQAIAFSRVRHHWSKDGVEASEEDGFDLLKRVIVREHVTADSVERQVRQRCGDLFVAASPVSPLLRDILDDRLGTMFTADDLVSALRLAGVTLRDWGRLPESVAAVHALRQRFSDQLGRHLIGRTLISRTQSTTVFKAITDPQSPKVVLIHGAAGSGKSGVLYELTNLLSEAGYCAVPLRLDNALPDGGSLLRYSREQLGLPDTPDRCAAKLAGGKRAVVIVDQLDAVRWGNVHSNPAWDVTVQLLEAVIRSANVSLVVACRTFDIKDDPNLRKWKDSQDIQHRLQEVEIPPLDVAQVEAALRAANYAVPGTAQLSLLRNPLMLWLWCDLTERGAALDGITGASSLLERHWQDIKARLAHNHDITDGAAEELAAQIREATASRGRLDFPAAAIPHGRGLEALASESFLDRLEPGRFRISHQRFLDFQVASAVYRDVLASRTTLAEWILAGEQSLMRREQVRQVIALLRDDDRDAYISAAHGLLTLPGVREHIRDLMLRLLAECAPLFPSEIQLTMQLHADPAWKERVRRRCWCTPVWWRALINAGLLKQLLLAEADQDREWAAWTLGQLAETDSEAVTSVLRPLVAEGILGTRTLAACLPFNMGHDTPELARWRFQAQRRGEKYLHVYEVTHAAQNHPKAALRFAVHLLRWSLAHTIRPGLMPEKPPADLDDWTSRIGGARAVLRQLSAAVPLDAWDAVLPLLSRSLRRQSRQGKSMPREQREPLGWGHPRRTLHSIFRMMLETAASSMPGLQSDRLWRTTKPLRTLRSRTATRLCASLVGSIQGAPLAAASRWLISDLRRLGAMGTSYSVKRFWHGRAIVRHVWQHMPAYRDRLLDAILSFRDVSERKHEHYRLAYVQQGRPDLVRSLVGLPQYLLLSAIPLEQLPPRALERLAQWDAKFCTRLERLRQPRPRRWLLSRPDAWKPESMSCSLHTARDLLPRDRLHLLSNAEWIKMASPVWTERMKRRWKERSVFARESPEELSDAAFQLATKTNPARFVRLVHGLPRTARDSWFEAILSAAAATEPEQGIAAPDWHPANAADVEACMELMGTRDSKHLAITLASLERTRPAEQWSDLTIDRLCKQAVSHPDPGPNDGGGYGNLATVDADKLIHIAINCARGVALEAIERLMWHHPGRHAQFIQVAEKAVTDPHPAVRMAAIALAGPLLNDQPETAIRLIDVACKGEDARVLMSHRLERLMRWLWQLDDPRIESILLRMSSSGIERVEEHGAFYSTAVFYREQRMREVALACATGNVVQRRGVARALAQMTDGQVREPTIAPRLSDFFDDDDQSVAGAAANAFRSDDLLRSSLGPELAARFVWSKQFARDPHDLVYPLKEFTGDLLPYQPVLADMVKRARTDMADLNGDLRRAGAGFADNATECILRIYERAQGSGHRIQREWCLDQIDSLVLVNAVEMDRALGSLLSGV